MAVGLHSGNVAAPWLNTLRNVSFQNASCWVQLHTADPTSVGTTGVSVGSTSRFSLTFNAAAVASGTESIALNASPTAWTNGGTSETITNISVWTASTAGSLLWTAALTVSKAWASADTLTLNTCGLSLSPTAV